MNTLTAGRISFVITQRLSAIRNADLISVIKDGDIVESGYHEKIQALGSFCAESYNSRFDFVA